MKLGILGYQHNKPFNIAVNKWRDLLFPKDRSAAFGFPAGTGSAFKFRVRRSPVFAQIGMPRGGNSASIPQNLHSLLLYRGLELPEPTLVFSDKPGTGTAADTHPMRGIVANRPYDFPLTLRGRRRCVSASCARAPKRRYYMAIFNRSIGANTPPPPNATISSTIRDFSRPTGSPLKYPRPAHRAGYSAPSLPERTSVQALYLRHSRSRARSRRCAHPMHRMTC